MLLNENEQIDNHQSFGVKIRFSKDEDVELYAWYLHAAYSQRVRSKFCIPHRFSANRGLKKAKKKYAKTSAPTFGCRKWVKQLWVMPMLFLSGKGLPIGMC